MKTKLNVATFQMNIAWENPEKNWEIILKETQNIVADVLILPEMFATGFSLDSSKTALINGEDMVSNMKELSCKLDCAIVGSLAIKENENYYNRLYWVNPNGESHTYDKRHLFRMAKEDKHYTQGKSSLIVEFRGVKFRPLICYDLRFPVWSRNTVNQNYDCLLYVANWPEARIDTWFSLLKARAIENLSYCIGVNRVGEDGNNIRYNGKSSVFDFKGKLVSNHKDNEAKICVTEIDVNQLKTFRKAFNAELDADSFTLF